MRALERGIGWSGCCIRPRVSRTFSPHDGPNSPSVRHRPLRRDWWPVICTKGMEGFATAIYYMRNVRWNQFLAVCFCSATQRRSCRVYWSIFAPAIIERIDLRARLETRVNQCALQCCNKTSFPYFCRPEHASSNQSSNPEKQAHFASNARGGSTRAFAHPLISPLSPSAIAV